VANLIFAGLIARIPTMNKASVNPADPPEQVFATILNNNQLYQQSQLNSGDVSTEIRRATASDGQTPYAVVIACSDSRVVPEHIFLAGVGELFTIRSAGNTIGQEALASIEYAVEHLGVRLIVMMGHKGCGALAAAQNPITSSEPPALQSLIDRIGRNIAGSADADEAVRQNLLQEVQSLSKSPRLAEQQSAGQLLIHGVVYDIASGAVELVI
jgi:carbonic anhydrase